MKKLNEIVIFFVALVSHFKAATTTTTDIKAKYYLNRLSFFYLI